MQTGDLEGAEALLLQASLSGAEFPRIASNLALVRSLRSSRPPQTGSAAPAKVPESILNATPVETPTDAVAPLADLATPEPSAADHAEQTSVADVGTDDLSMVSERETLPTHRDLGARPVTPKTPEAQPKPKPAVLPPGPPGNTPKSEPIPHMRPTPSDDKQDVPRPPLRSAKNAVAAAPLGSHATTSETPALRPASVESAAGREASVQR
jgi:hypothetical protein